MKLPKSLTKVTPLSKTLALVLFIALPLVGFFFGMQYQRLVDVTTFMQMEDVSVIPVKNEVTITLTDNNKTVYAQVGQNVVVSLGNNMKWGVKVSNPDVLSSTSTAGQYKADVSGTVIISAVGTPVCEKGKLCSMLAELFKTTLVIK